MNVAELPITGYLDRFSHRPSETFIAHVGMRQAGPYQARLVRVISGDPNPAGPKLRFEDLSSVFAASFKGRHQNIRLGSYGIVEEGPNLDPRLPLTLTALVQLRAPLVPDATAKAVLAVEGEECALVLAVGPRGAEARLTSSAENKGAIEFRLCAGTPLREGEWHRLWFSVDPSAGRVALGQQAVTRASPILEAQRRELTLPSQTSVLIAAERKAAPSRHFTGKIEDPAILGAFIDAWPRPLARLKELGAELIAGWDFSRGIDTQAISDVGPQARHGRLVNLPMRAVVGARWSGREMCWRHAPEDYAAIHFHDDDLEDCAWQPDFNWTVPPGLKSGAYAFHLTCETGEDWLPFYVLPPRQGPFAPIAFLASTFTYQAYANHARGNGDDAYHRRAAEWGAYPHNPDQHPIYSTSTYNRHADGSGIAFSSRRRPILTMRPGFLTFNDQRGSGLRHYPADTHILAWLEEKGFPFDIITDEDLDDEGEELIAPYRTVLTGSHPEYHTLRTLDALQNYTQAGGKLAYLGGNGFYWRIARSKALPHVIEIRRAEGGIRAWAAEPGEYYHALDGEFGGLWRRNRRPPQMLAGVGFSGQGLFEGTHYRRLPASRDPAHAWMFEGIEEEIIGDYGLSGGGAAGFEMDRADRALGTPENAVILARSQDPPASFVTVPEELLSHLHTVSGEPPNELKRAEIVYFDTGRGGAVFSVGSITFCGSLWRNGFEGPVSRLLENVLRRFSAANADEKVASKLGKTGAPAHHQP
ncbi:MAG: N,N-dimethylformamidase large subunit [Hyphomicrobiales bacterium]|nr:N,N-dimethylformamidase large subunit [Hyphomicrobiales bacterium]